MFKEDHVYDVAQVFRPSLPPLFSEEVSIACGGLYFEGLGFVIAIPGKLVL